MVMVGTNREREKERERNICNVWALIGKGIRRVTGRVRKEWFLMVLIGKRERKINNIPIKRMEKNLRKLTKI